MTDRGTSTAPLLLGVDLGTTSLKCGLFDLAGRRLGGARVEVRTDERGARAEQDATEWWQALVSGVRRAVAGAESARVAALAVGGHAPSPVFADDDLVPMAPVMTWADRRAEGHRERLLKTLGRPPTAGPERLMVEVAARALWLRDERPARFTRAACALHSGDYLVARLTGLCASTVPTSPDVEAAAGPCRRLFRSKPHRAGQRMAETLPEVTRLLGLRAPVPVVAGGLDSFLASIGSGILEPGDACWNTGSSAVGALLLQGPARGRFTWAGRPLASQVLLLGGRAVSWAQERAFPGGTLPEFLSESARTRAPLRLEPVVALLQAAARGAPAVRGTLARLARRATPGEVGRAVLVALSFELRHLLETWERQGQPARRIRVVGRLAAHPAVTQLRADALGHPLEVPRVTDSGTLGAAMAAATALELSTPSQAARMASVERTCTPHGPRAAFLASAYREALQAWHAPERVAGTSSRVRT